MKFLYKYKKIIKFIFPIILILVIFIFLENIVLANTVTSSQTTNNPQTTKTKTDDDAIAGILSWIVFGITSALGYILTIIMYVVNWLFSFQDFWTNDAVNIGWTITRDIANMGFILILLIIAFSTILRLPNYSIKQTLPKLILMAILINFSKTITLLAIDISQVVMLTFASAFAGSPGNFAEALQIKSFSEVVKYRAKIIPATTWPVFYGLVLSFIAMVISIIIMIMLAGMLVMRVVMLLVLIVVSPLAFMSYALSGKYFSQWVSELNKYLISGPVLAFFVWLALSILGQTQMKLDEELQVGMTSIGNSKFFTKYLLAIALLIGAMKITQSFGAAGSSIGMNLTNKAKNKGSDLLKKGRTLLEKGALTSAKATGRTVLRGAGSIIQFEDKEGKTTHGKIGGFLNQWSNDLRSTRLQEKIEKRKKTLGKLGMKDSIGGSMEKLQEMLEDKKIKRATNIVKGVGLGAAGVLSGSPLLGIAGLVAGSLKVFSNKGIIADRLESFGKSRELINAEEDRDKIKKRIMDERKNKLSDNENKRENDLNQNKNNRNAAILQFRANNIGSSNQDYETRLKEINEAYDDEKDKINKYYDEEIKKINKEGQNEIDKAEQNVKDIESRRGWFRRGSEAIEKSMLGPNELTINAAKEATKQNAEIHNLIKELGEELVHEFSKSTFFSPGGPSTKQQKLFDALNANTEAAAKAIKNMTDAIEKMPETLNETQKQTVLALKQLLAAQQAAGKNMTAFSSLISGLNNRIDVKDKKGNYTIEDIAKSKS